MDYNFWYVRKDELDLRPNRVITPGSAVTNYSVREHSPMNAAETYDLAGLADLIAETVLKEDADLVRLFRAHNEAGSEHVGLPCLLATKDLVSVFGAESIGDELLDIQRKVGQRIINRRKP